MAAVGANQWKGGFLKYKKRNNRTETFDPADMDPDSYLGTNITQHNTVKKREVVVARVFDCGPRTNKCLKMGSSFQHLA